MFFRGKHREDRCAAEGGKKKIGEKNNFLLGKNRKKGKKGDFSPKKGKKENKGNKRKIKEKKELLDTLPSELGEEVLIILLFL